MGCGDWGGSVDGVSKRPEMEQVYVWACIKGIRYGARW